MNLLKNHYAYMYICKSFSRTVNEEREISASVDAGWQRRGSGKAYNSLSGKCGSTCSILIMIKICVSGITCILPVHLRNK